ncbi:glycoside hydrolase family 6 protein [Serratia sp. M24T3]|uniref:glycoside hydrolase family 6 protein n=1 Tax=Serratia sp. M24T3 TaxID=932213 RepID=UPI000561C5AA|nr:glycoside hydrolase family 6 protein [Serratia sp. M24T3]
MTLIEDNTLRIMFYFAVLLISSTLFAAEAADSFYVNPNSTAAEWVKQHPNDPRQAVIQQSIANVPMARWFTGSLRDKDNLSQQVSSYVSAAVKKHQVPLMVAYNIPHRDCSGVASAGGAATPESYRQWVNEFANGVKGRKAVIVLEPDSLGDIGCLDKEQQSVRLGLLKYAVDTFNSKAPAAQLYLDAGNARWKPAAVMAEYLDNAGLKNAKGFALNVSNSYSTPESISYADRINIILLKNYGYKKTILIDTSRNGQAAKAGEWCNAAGPKLGIPTQQLSANIFAAWIKVPGNSDGDYSPKADCHGGPKAGVFSADLAMRLIIN